MIPANKMNHVAIIILSYNKKEDLLGCLESISSMDYTDYEVIVVDNNSTDGSAAAVKCRFSSVHLIESKVNTGVAGGRNLGIKYADKNIHYNFILFLDEDTTIERNALTEMVKSITVNDKIGIVTPKCRLSNAPDIIGYAGGMSVNLFTGKIRDIGGGERDKGQYNKSKFISSSGGLCLVRKEMLNKTGLFDEKFNPYGWEDVDLSLRARKKFYKILYCPEAVIFHKGGKKGRGKAIDEYEFSKSKNYFYLIKKHANVLQLLSISLILPFRIMTIVLRELLGGEFSLLHAKLLGFFKFARIK